VVLGGEDVARRPRDLGTEGGEGLNEDGGLDGPACQLYDSYILSSNIHVETSSNSGTLQGLVGAVLLTDSHESGHLVLSKLDFLSAEGGEGDVCDFVVGLYCG